MGRAAGEARSMVRPAKPVPGDRVAILSPSFGGPARFPAPYELGLRRLRQHFGLAPVEFPTTGVLGASPQARAADLHAAFMDPSITAVLTSIGGSDQLKVLRHVDIGVLAAHPKPFFGYSDSTNLLHLLWRAGVVGYHGCAVMVQLGRPGGLHPTTAESLRRALFTTGDYVLPQPESSTDEEQCDWDVASTLEAEPVLDPAAAWQWHGPQRQVRGPAWGGNLEIIDFQLRTGRYLGPVTDYAGAVLFFETSEEMPSATYVSRVLMGMGERGMLGQFAAVLVGRAKAWSFEQPNDAAAKARYAEEQHATVLDAVAEYNPEAVVVLDVDLGHTDPQVVIPHGGAITVDPLERRITVEY